MKFKDVIWSWDFWCASAATAAVLGLLPYWVPNDFAHDLYAVGISVLSIVFAVYFAALAIIISAGDNDFICFMEEKGDYSGIIDTFQFSLAALFVAMLYSIAMYAFTSAWVSKKLENQPCWWLVIFGFLFLYSMFAALNSTLDSIRYARRRTEFLGITRKKTGDGTQTHVHS